MSLVELTVAEASAAVARREVSPVELTDAVLARLDAVDGTLHAYATVIAETARASAAEAEREIAAGRYRGPLHGIPFGLKDLIDVAGLPTGAGSQVRQGHLAAADSAVAARLSEAGAILVGKTHTHEFAYGLTTPQTRNAWDPGRVAGGSSGGSAVAVAAGSALFALGTDTGGSIRVPAALNGVVGLKPTYGLVSRHGVVPLSWSLDHVGPITRTVADAALVLPALAGHDPRDPASLPGAAFEAGESEGLRGLRVGVPVNHYFEHVDPAVEAAVRAAVARLEQLGARLVEIEIPYARFIQATQWGLMVPEATAYHEPTLRSSPELYAPDVRVLLEAGALLPAADHVRARRARSLMRQAWSELFGRVDVIAAPATPITAAPAGQDSVTWPDGTVEAVSDAYVRLSAPANITGVPALTLPAGHDEAGLPIGLQLMGPALGESRLLSVGRACEQALDRAGTLAPVAA
ncbi:Aspartyl-tRNA(Asn) amidotransferase subunit A @ Glutamyl-tRNA(Gln) amidotransferase subunit A [[Actinomadura] parvosata subsp. kistnae]|uniref:Amidase n=1 Tax=[Actinomadura] parvosata subsp. kistnae TaxID=1909395 RepID=A0A1V0A871_9ACTN|nr:Asp-tRNA(Asn)/Glu-tRNA(Gln) amidotransferase GatCAB subunit A [Nonomuraea sp. ATCC 55076]AQZ66416.1 amidase [Nonomuraea sp. ATCC 55076]SPL95530.1 Aspartyl-tRNA(Asn) amidotransferase subunit A @ Glutamyl-tRNA(Gln) amidotransferase subunit A [Actinomadura parvosata subsp. kistnae]